jgi:hypothetical protein
VSFGVTPAAGGNSCLVAFRSAGKRHVARYRGVGGDSLCRRQWRVRDQSDPGWTAGVADHARGAPVRRLTQCVRGDLERQPVQGAMPLSIRRRGAPVRTGRPEPGGRRVRDSHDAHDPRRAGTRRRVRRCTHRGACSGERAGSRALPSASQPATSLAQSSPARQTKDTQQRD